MQRKLSVTGLGYVGLPVAVAFARHGRVVGFDINAGRVRELRGGVDRTHEVDGAALRGADIHFTSDPADLRAADFHIVAVPTPIDAEHEPDLTALVAASELVGAQLKAGDVVVYESTVYPGLTEEVCLPLLESASGLACGPDFKLGYSPERINPGDREHTFEAITKVVAACDAEGLEVVAQVYGQVVAAGVHRAPSIRVAEAAKVIENTQRDLNIALMNELTMLFHGLGIDTGAVLAAARTKWNFLPFEPGLVGGHCVGVDPYYLTHIAARHGYDPQVILAGRRINDGMGAYVAAQALALLDRHGVEPAGATATVLGLTFKENVPDLRNSKVVEVIRALEAAGITVQAHDPLAAPEDAREQCGVELRALEDLAPAPLVVLAVPHRAFREGGWPLVQRLLAPGAGVVADVRRVLPPDGAPPGVALWRL